MKNYVPLIQSKRLLLLTALLISVSSCAFALNLLVYNNNDSGAGSLRQAIADNNASVGTNSIIFSNIVTGTITLTSGQLSISKNLTIIGPGANVLTVSGNQASRVFYVNNTTAIISGLTVRNGSATGTSPADYGGGIFCHSSLGFSAALTVSNCVVNGNTASYGAGIMNFNAASFGNSALKVIGCTISSNVATQVGGGIYNNGVYLASTVINNSTISGNSGGAYGGGIVNITSSGQAFVTVIGCTISGNSSGIYNLGNGDFGGVASVSIGSTILKAGASGANVSSPANGGSFLNSQGYNLSSDGASGRLNGTGDQINTDPKLGPLQNNGGPTMTHALLSNSPAIDKGLSFGATTDQRGAPRTFDFSSTANASGGDGSDIGAFELGRPTLNIQKFTTNAVLSWQSYYGDFTLQSVTNVIASNSWANVAGTPAVVASQYVLTNGPISANKFYRLKGN